MDLFLNYFVVSGRIDRATYWRAIIIYLCALSLVGLVVIGVEAALSGHGQAGLPGPLGLVGVIPISVRRLHDRGASGWRLLMFFALPAALDHVAGVDSAGLSFFFSMAELALSIWGFIALGCLRGDAGANRYGPDPLAD
jgi:uncharacterized membrane protein YhaH (DUF805 family)